QDEMGLFSNRFFHSLRARLRFYWFITYGAQCGGENKSGVFNVLNDKDSLGHVHLRSGLKYRYDAMDSVTGETVNRLSKGRAHTNDLKTLLLFPDVLRTARDFLDQE